MNAIELNHICKSFGSFAIQDLNLTVPSGTICGLVGENGAGKSTTIRLLMGALRPDSGTASVLGTDASSPEFVRIREDVGVVLDETFVPEILTARQLGRIMAGTFRSWDQAAYEKWIARLELPEGKKFKEYSRGMTMKLGIAAALSHNAKLLLLDEATGGLDPMVREELLEVFADFAAEDGHAVLLSSHIVSDLEKLCDYIAFLHQGRLLFCEEKDRLLEDYGVFVGTAEQAESLLPEAVAGREARDYGGVRALVRRSMVPESLALERPTVEEIILFIVKGAEKR